MREEKLLTILNLADFNPNLKTKNINLDRLLKLAELNAVLPLSIKNLKKLQKKFNIPDKYQEKIDNINIRNQKRREKAKIFLKLFNKNNIETIILKGFLFADTLYNDPNYKTMNDVDILVKKSDAPKASRLLKSLGYFNYESYYDDTEVSNKTHHAPAYTCENNDCVVGLHWGLITPKAPYKPDIHHIWKEKLPARVADTDCFQMCPEDNVLHLCLHLPFYKIGLRELADVYNLILLSNFDWQKFDNHVQKSKSYDPVFRVLSLTNALQDISIPADLLDKYKTFASYFVKQDVKIRLENPELILHSRSVHLGKIEKQYVILRRSEQLKEKFSALINMYLLIYFPNRSEIQKLSGNFKSSHFNLITHAKSIFGLWRALMIDHGKGALVGLQVAGFYEIAKALRYLKTSLNGKTFSEMPEADLVHILE